MLFADDTSGARTENRRAFASHCQFLAASAWNCVGPEQQSATDELIKLYVFFESRTTENDDELKTTKKVEGHETTKEKDGLELFRELAPFACFVCKRIRSSDPNRFEAAKSSKSGRPEDKNAMLVICLLIEEKYKKTNDITQAVDLVFNENWVIQKDSARKYFERFRLGHLFSPEEIAASRELLFR
jgi:hypothetical protein